MTCCVFGFFPRTYGHLLMQNSHLTVLRQATQLSLAQSESAKALQGHTADTVGVSLLSFQYEDYKKLFSLWDFFYHLCDATTPRWRSAALSERQRVFAEQSLTGARKYPENEACSCKQNPSPIYNPTIFSHYSITAFGSVPPAPDIFRSHIHSFCVYVAAGSWCSL